MSDLYTIETIKVHLQDAKDYLASLPRSLHGATVTVDPKYVATIKVSGFADDAAKALADIRAGLAKAGIDVIADEPKPKTVVSRGKAVRASQAWRLDVPAGARVSECIECGDPAMRGRMLCEACA